MVETVFKLESHPQVETAVTTEEEGGSVRKRFVVWGLNMSIGVDPSSMLSIDCFSFLVDNQN